MRSIDWDKPITAAGCPNAARSSPLYGEVADVGGPRTRYTYTGLRDEQIRRAKILIDAAGGRELTVAGLSARIARLAEVIPGLRYKVGGLVYSGLAPLADPAQISLMAGAAALPSSHEVKGKPVGRERRWTADRLEALREMVATLIAEKERAMTDVEALKVIRSEWRAAHGHPPSLKTLQNRLSEARR